MTDPTPAAYGAAMLDRVTPGWHERIDLAELNLGDCHDCILGQLYGWYITGRDTLGLDLDGSARYGFSLGIDAAMAERPDEAYLRLTERWVREVTHRLKWDVEKLAQRQLRAAEAAGADDDLADEL